MVHLELLFLAFYYSSELTFLLNLVKPTFPILLLITMSILEFSLGRMGLSLQSILLRGHRRVAVSLVAAAGWEEGQTWLQLRAGSGAGAQGAEMSLSTPWGSERGQDSPCPNSSLQGPERLRGHRRR